MTDALEGRMLVRDPLTGIYSTVSVEDVPETTPIIETPVVEQPKKETFQPRKYGKRK